MIKSNEFEGAFYSNREHLLRQRKKKRKGSTVEENMLRKQLKKTEIKSA